MNNAQFLGNLGKDFEIQEHTKKSNGEAFIVAKNSLAITEKITTKDANGDKIIKEHTDWIPIQIFGKSAENAEKYFKKGDKFLCDGKIRTSSYVDEKDGQTKTSFCLEVKKFYFTKPKEKESTQAQSPTPQNLPEIPPELENTNIISDEIIENAEEIKEVF